MNNTENKDKRERKTYTNYDIFPGKVQLVGENGASVVERDVAIEMAKKEGKTLVQISYNKNSFPKAICKILDLGKMKYEQKKKDKEQARKLRIANAEAKEIIFSIRIDDGDKSTKTEHARKFLVEDKTKVKITVKLSRREMNLLGMAKDLMREVLDKLTDVAELDSNPSFNSGLMSCVLRPIKK